LLYGTHSDLRWLPPYSFRHYQQRNRSADSHLRLPSKTFNTAGLYTFVIIILNNILRKQFTAEIQALRNHCFNGAPAKWKIFSPGKPAEVRRKRFILPHDAK